MTLIGYTDRLSVAPGERVEFMVTCEVPTYSARMVRLVHGDRNPAGPGLKQEELGDPVDGSYRGRRQETSIGSYAVVDGLPRLETGFGLALWICPTVVDGEAAPQCVASRHSAGGAGFALRIEDGRLRLELTDEAGATYGATAPARLRAGCWCFAYAGLDAAGTLSVGWETDAWLAESSSASADGPAGRWEAGERLHLAAEAGDGEVRAHYNGKIADPKLFGRSLRDSERRAVRAGDDGAAGAAAALLGAWNLGSDPSANGFRDTSGRGHDGELVNRPMAAVTNQRWDGSSTDWTARPEHYSAVAFHADDLADAGWSVDFTWSVPADLPSGVYAAWLQAGEREDHVPIVVRPPRAHGTAPVGVLLPTFTYLAYANERMYENREGTQGSSGIFADLDFDPREAELAEHPEWGKSLYDNHPDGSGVCYSSAKRPILNLRPDYRMWAFPAGEYLCADLYLIDWLCEKGFDHDVFTDHDLHGDGAALLERYRVIVTGGHPEYWSAQMLDALRSYLDAGGRLMYLGGNGFYWVTSVDPANPHIIEVRRGYNGTRVWESAPGEGCHSTTGEQGGLWRYRGRDPNRLVGIGFASQGFSKVAPGYERNPAAAGPIADLVFDGVSEEPFGTYGLIMDGAAGVEIDRADPARGTPDHTIVLASSTGHDDGYLLAVEDVLLMAPELGGTEHPDVRSDVTFTETPNDGAVFAAGSIIWRASLSHADYDNGVSRITENVLRAFLTVESWPPHGQPRARRVEDG